MRRLSVVFGMIAMMFFVSSSANAQGLLDKAKDVAKKTSVGKSVRKLGAEGKLLDAATVDLDAKNLSKVQVGPLQLGISAIDIKNGDAVRLKLFLYNPSQQPVTIPLPPTELFVLVDDKGRKPEILGDVSVKGLADGAIEIVVPALERIELNLIFESIAADAKTGALKVGSNGAITGIPLNTTAASTSTSGGQSSSPWKQD